MVRPPAWVVLVGWSLLVASTIAPTTAITGSAQIVLHPENSTVVPDGDTVLLTCVATGDLPLSISWSREGSVLMNDSQRITITEREIKEGGTTFIRSILRICSTGANDAGVYSCIAENEAGNDTATFELNVAPPEGAAQIVLHPVDSTVIPDGDTVLLTCVATGDLPLSISWSREGNVLMNDSQRITITEREIKEGGTTFIRSILRICSTGANDAGVYSCIAENEAGNDTATFELNVAPPEGAAQIVLHPVDSTVIPDGDTVLLTCVAYGDLPLSISWSREGSVLMNDSQRITITEREIKEGGTTFIRSILRICSTGANDAGVYSCIAENEAGNDTATFELNVAPPEGAAQVVLHPVDSTVIPDGDTVLLTCVATGDLPLSISWSREGNVLMNDSQRITITEREIEEGGTTFIRSILRLCSTGANDAGVYSCIAENEAGNDTATFELNVTPPEGEAQIVLHPVEPTDVPDGDTVLLTCVATGDLPLSISWSREGSVLMNDSQRITITEREIEEGGTTVIRSILRICSTEANDAGVYSCIAENEADNDTATFELDVAPPEEFGFCDDEVSITSRGNYTWPETTADNVVELECQLGPATGMASEAAIGRRRCNASGEWEDPQLENCITMVALQLQQLEEELNNTEVTEENVVEVNQDLRDIIDQAGEEDQTEANLEVVASVFTSTAGLLSEPTVVVEEATVDDIVEVLDDIQVWPEEVVEDMGSDIVEAFEQIVTDLVEQENFTNLTFVGEDLIFTAERVGVEILVANGREFSSSRDENGTLGTASGGAGSAEESLAPEELGTAFLPSSLFTQLESSAGEVGIFFTLYESPSLFPIAGELDLPNEDGIMSQVGSPVVAATVSMGGQTEFSNLTDPVIVVLRLNPGNITRRTCVSYDFNLADGTGNWTSEGCSTTVSEDDPNIVICSCNHLTNFACLVDICARTEGCEISSIALTVLEVLSFIGVSLSAVGLVLTVATLLGFKKLRERDATKFHVQLCIAIFCMLLVFVIGIDRVPPKYLYGGCVAVSSLIHYFTLVAVMWMGAEALLMFQKLVIVFTQITTKYMVIVSIVCWVAPIIPVVVPLGIDRDFMVTHNSDNDISFCFIGDRRVFFGAFLGPILAVLLFNLVIFVMVVTVLLRHTRNTMGRMKEQMNQKTTIRLLISITGIVFLFGLTWVFGALTISDASLPFQIIFVVSNGFQGFFIFLFFCVFSKDARELWVEFLTCGRYKSVSHPSRVVSAGKYMSGGTKEQNPTGTGNFQLTSQSYQTSSEPLILSLVSEHEENPYVSEGQMPMLGGGSSTFLRSNKIIEGGDITCIENPHANDASEIQPGEVPSLTLDGDSSSEVNKVAFGTKNDAETSNHPTISITAFHNAAEFKENELVMDFDIQFNEESGVQI